MIQPYTYKELTPDTQYYFASIGEKGKIIKVVVFFPIAENVWNLGFGDLQNDGLIDDLVVTNNQDARKVLQTVAKIAIDYLARFPNRILELKPSDEKRKKLYNSIFQRYFSDIELIFTVTGFLGTGEEQYIPSIFYDKFRITIKL